jgi:hypothetical protein
MVKNTIKVTCKKRKSVSVLAKLFEMPLLSFRILLSVKQ